MQIIRTTRKTKCSFTPNCLNVGMYKIKTNKYSLGICAECLLKLHNSISALIVPKAIVTKFKIKR